MKQLEVQSELRVPTHAASSAAQALREARAHASAFRFARTPPRARAGARMAGHAMLRCLLVLLVALPLGAAVTPGPGSGAWEHGRPEEHGMLSSQSE
eukprot:COSAG02_NODE_2937_length_7700_cov_9.549007_4_plen_97_part_00